MNDVVKGLRMVLGILYVISPVEVCPGPIDDIIVALFALAGMKAKAD